MAIRQTLAQLRLARSIVAVAMLVAWPALAMACAGCMNDDPIWQRKFPILLGFIGFPFLLFGVVFWAIRRHVGSAPRAAHASAQPKIQE